MRTAAPPTAAPMMAPIGVLWLLEVEAAAAAGVDVDCALDCAAVVVARVEEELVADGVADGVVDVVDEVLLALEAG
jgi:hypothetical protein